MPAVRTTVQLSHHRAGSRAGCAARSCVKKRGAASTQLRSCQVSTSAGRLCGLRGLAREVSPSPALNNADVIPNLGETNSREHPACVRLNSRCTLVQNRFPEAKANTVPSEDALDRLRRGRNVG